MDYYKLLELQQMKQRREAMEKSYPKERECKLRKRKQELLEEKKDLLVLEDKLRLHAAEIQTLQRNRQQSEQDISRLNRSLYEGDHSPKELQNIQQRLDGLETALQQLKQHCEEDNTQACNRRQELRERRDALVDRMNDYESKVEEYLAERSRLVEKLRQLDEQIEQFIRKLESSEREFFDKETQRYGVEVFSALKKGRFCSSCNVLLESEVLAAVKDGRPGTRCTNCGRMILNVNDDNSDQ